jgi:hypothetical protein
MYSNSAVRGKSAIRGGNLKKVKASLVLWRGLYKRHMALTGMERYEYSF